MRHPLLCLFGLVLLVCSCSKNRSESLINDDVIHFEKINYYKNPFNDTSQLAFKSRLEYYFKSGKPHRWIELDSNTKIQTDYVYRFNSIGKHIGAYYTEDGSTEYSEELVRFENDSTQITEWIDSIRTVYYTMIDNLNSKGKTYRATFIGDTTHGYDSTFYTKEGFEKRIFFTNVKGKVYNDRYFEYDSINEYGDWTYRRKIMNDSVVEYHKREVYYDSNFTSETGQFYQSVISSHSWDENVFSFTEDEAIVFFTRTKDWDNQFAYLSESEDGLFTLPKRMTSLDTIYNGAISPDGRKILYTTKNEDQETTWLIEDENGEWSNRVNLTETSGIQAGYFNWLNNEDIFFYVPDNNGDIVEGKLKGDKLMITNALEMLNTKEATEFSPFVDRQKKFIIFTRYLEGDVSQQGFFISHNENTFDNPKWTSPKKIKKLPYGWSAYITKDYSRFLYSDGIDIRSVALDTLDLKLP